MIAARPGDDDKAREKNAARSRLPRQAQAGLETAPDGRANNRERAGASRRADEEASITGEALECRA
ncbi:hypothetical protein CKO21_09045 [Rhodovibrio salinarum]|uniref:Uncharacterized protein n=1 Tax=Rhodovibrio salinarum TaxID=1087 RepID=A0A934V0G1_9PROT|nr:hypothetical protein [Rhodovibrio salinarum]